MKYYRKLYILAFVFLICFVGIFSVYSNVFAQSVNEDTTNEVIRQLQAGTLQAGYGEGAVDPRLTAMRFVRIGLGLLGTVFVFLFFISGYWFITSHGEEEKISKARKTMQGAVIGILVILSAYSITNFVMSRITQASGIIPSASQPQFFE
ncbi:MAG: hypothetical protein WCW16_01995 [Candidatus Magasanikbacteria bacterium]